MSACDTHEENLHSKYIKKFILKVYRMTTNQVSEDKYYSRKTGISLEGKQIGNKCKRKELKATSID